MKAQIKGFSMVCMAALLLSAASCKKETKEETEYEGGFTAKAEAQQNDSKVYLVGSGLEWNLEWNNDESIMVFNSGGDEPTSYKFTSYKVCIDEANFKPDPEAGFSQSFYRNGGYTAYYPYDKMTNDEGTVSFTMPATQTYTVCDGHVTFDRNAFPRAGKTDTPAADDRFIHFKNVCGLLKLQLYSTTLCQVQNISITSNTGEQLCGTGTVGFDTDNNPTLSALTGGGSTLMLDMGTTGKPMSINADSPSAYYFVVPAGTLGTGFTVKVTETNGDMWTKTANAPANLIARSKITVLPKLPVATTHTPVSPSEVTVTAGCSDDYVYNLGGSVTVPDDGEYTCEFGLVYSEINDEPTVADMKVVAGTATFSETKTFSADITGLAAGTTYHVRAYAKIDDVAYSTGVRDIVGGDGPQPMTWTDGKSPMKFSINSTQTVCFSQGNLQYNATGSSAEAASGANVGGTWRFAEHQFDFIGAANAHAAQNYDDWIDLFGFGTSGYNHGATCYQPWSTSTENEDYYASSLYEQSDMADWGKAYSISNGGGSSWRTLTTGEWQYLINRTDDSGNLLYGEGKVGNCTPGLIILPDEWSCPTGVPDVSRGKFSWSNVYSYSEWAKMETAGAVFLPAAGYRSGTSLENVGSEGDYWSSSCKSTVNSYYLYFDSGDVNPGNSYSHRLGMSVRLVSDN